MPETILALPAGDQTNLSERIRTLVKTIASRKKGGLVSLMKAADFPYKRAWEQLNRTQGVLVDFLPVLAALGIDGPIVEAADACGYHVTPKEKFLRKGQKPERPVRSYALSLHHRAAGVTMEVEEALADGRVDSREIRKIKAVLHELRVDMAELEDRIEGNRT